MSYQIRPIGQADARAFAELMVELAGETANTLLTVAESARLVASQGERTRELLAAPNQGVFLAWEGAALVGYLGISQGLFERNRHAASLTIGVLRRAWGGGVAGRLMQAALDWAAGRGVQRIELSLLASNTRARRFYARHGFAAEGRKRRSMRFSDRWEDELVMARVLD